MQSVTTWRQLASSVTALIFPGMLLSGCEVGDWNIGAAGIEKARPVERFKYGSPEQVEELAGTLTKYSERGQKYVDALRGLMKTNMLMATGDAYLGAGPTILLIPVGAGS